MILVVGRVLVTIVLQVLPWLTYMVPTEVPRVLPRRVKKFLRSLPPPFLVTKSSLLAVVPRIRAMQRRLWCIDPLLTRTVLTLLRLGVGRLVLSMLWLQCYVAVVGMLRMVITTLRGRRWVRRSMQCTSC